MEQKLFDAAQKLPETTLDFENVDPIPKLAKTFRLPRAFWTVAACLVLVVCISLGAFTIVVEAKEYQDALAFFEEYGLSTEGLTREEIKDIYRDITEDSFSLPKTMEVFTLERLLKHHINIGGIDKIPGFMIMQSAPTVQEMETLGNLNNGNWEAPTPAGIYYDYSSEYEADENGYLTLARNYVEKYDGELLLWKILISDKFRITGVFPVADGVIVAGTDQVQNQWNSWITKISPTGQVLFSQKKTGDYWQETVANVLGNSDGSFTTFSRCVQSNGKNIIKVSEYSNRGELVATGGYAIASNLGGTVGAVTRWGDGYAMQVILNSPSLYPEVVLMDKNLIAKKTISFSSSTENFWITDMLTVNGKIYLSAYATRMQGPLDQPRNEISNVLNYLQKNDITSISSTELTPKVRSNYTAMLLVCDAESGTPEIFYSVDGSMGGKLSYTTYGTLLWDVESIASTFYSPSTDSFTIGGTCMVYRYSFLGNRITQQKTDEITIYRR